MDIKRIAYLSMALLIIIAVTQIALSQELIQESDNLVVPDSYYVAKRCSEPQDKLKRVRDKKELLRYVNIKAADILASEMSSLCDKEAKGEISSDSWFEQFEKMSVSFDQLTYSCEQADFGGGIKAISILPPAQRTIPTNFKAYTMFLFPSIDLSKSEKAIEMDFRGIRRSFASFGDSIGDKRVAIWFTKGRFSKIPDTKRSKYYCDLLKLSYNDGPYIVTSFKRPDEIHPKDEFVVIKLGGITPGRIIKVLNILEQDLNAVELRIKVLAI